MVPVGDERLPGREVALHPADQRRVGDRPDPLAEPVLGDGGTSRGRRRPVVDDGRGVAAAVVDEQDRLEVGAGAPASARAGRRPARASRPRAGARPGRPGPQADRREQAALEHAAPACS